MLKILAIVALATGNHELLTIVTILWIFFG
jgi:hypothetical protein